MAKLGRKFTNSDIPSPSSSSSLTLLSPASFANFLPLKSFFLLSAVLKDRTDALLLKSLRELSWLFIIGMATSVKTVTGSNDFADSYA